MLLVGGGDKSTLRSLQRELARLKRTKLKVPILGGDHPADVAWMITSENGHFEFDSLKPGKFSLQGAKRGFIPAAYEQHEQFSTAIVTGAGFNTENLVLRLTPLALLGGKVIDESGEPVRNARLILYVENRRGGMNRIMRAGSGSCLHGGFPR